MSNLPASDLHKRLGNVLGLARYYIEQEATQIDDWHEAYRRVEADFERLLTTAGNTNIKAMREAAADTYQRHKEGW